ncbi:anthranilate synthase component I [Aquisalibacillus elongatus]|uniref:Anthranilate synthase component 1 n=1 Tax=Aquisalibacillus elongatus TaxID=485577 RepID=A0A3N5B757_9BACI|nr:anthranilate synthase component I [Aquisalibacillus elongatus]RPF53264.1 anthranilate synthase component I [Aquisalibacillus elongatus]
MVQCHYRIVEGDTLTPISIYLNLKGGQKFLLESSLKHEKSGRYSFIGASPYNELKSNDVHQAFQTIENTLNTELDLPIDIPFPTGGVGYVAYDAIRHFENIGDDAIDELHMPDVHFMFYDTIIVYDHLMQKVYIITLADESELDEIEHQLFENTENQHEPFSLSSFQSNTAQKTFEKKVDQIKEHIAAGDIFQAVLTQRFSAQYEGDAFEFYRKLRKSNPSPYMFFIDFQDYIVLGASPESLIKVNDRTVTTNPIAGTRKRGLTESDDQKLAQDLISDEKEIAEHQMLVDLGRNDLGRICIPGSINLSKYMVIERYRYVMHIVSEVVGELAEQYTSLEALKACLPAGTVSGAPKIRAMQILNDLEDVKRGVYSGAVGYIAINGNLDFALAIRTMVLKDQQAYVQAGAGVVHDSNPLSEYEETIHKARALMEVN